MNKPHSFYRREGFTVTDSSMDPDMLAILEKYPHIPFTNPHPYSRYFFLDL